MMPYRPPPPDLPARPSDSLKPLGKAMLSWCLLVFCVELLVSAGLAATWYQPLAMLGFLGLALLHERWSYDRAFLNGRREEHEAWLRSYEPLGETREKLLGTLAARGTHWGGPR